MGYRLTCRVLQMAGVNLMVTLTEKRGKDTLHMYLQFLNSVLMECAQAPQMLTSARRKDGALFSIGAMERKCALSLTSTPLLSPHHNMGGLERFPPLG